MESILDTLINTSRISFQEVLAVKNRYLPDLLKLGGIDGVRMGITYHPNNLGYNHCIQVFARDAVVGHIPIELDGVEVDIVVTDRVVRIS